MAIRTWSRFVGGRRPAPGLKFAYHGQWCGPGHSGINYRYCDDLLDCACADHDFEYERADAFEGR